MADCMLHFTQFWQRDSPSLKQWAPNSSEERQQLRGEGSPCWRLGEFFRIKLINPGWVNVTIVNSHSMIQKVKVILKEVVLNPLSWLLENYWGFTNPLVMTFLERFSSKMWVHFESDPRGYHLFRKHSHQTIIFQEWEMHAHLTSAKMNCILRFLLWNTLW